MKELGVCVLLGGESDEREISIKSGTAITEALKRKGIFAYAVDASNGFRKMLKEKKPDIAFIAVHGRGGEDGKLQSALSKLRIPYVGSSPKASKLAFDKDRAKKIFHQNNIPTPPGYVITRKNWKKLMNKIALPAVIKPTQNGSSIGVLMVVTRAELKKKIQESIKIYPRLLIEQKIEGREFTVGILGARALPVIELKPKRSFYDYRAKYTKGLTDYLVPAPIHLKLQKELSRLAEKTNRVLGLRDFCRIDFMVDSSGKPYVLEANSIPGFTETSLLPKAAKAVGIGFEDLCCKILNLAKKRARIS